MKTIHEDDDLLVVDKLSGVVVTDICPELEKIHRLDKDTSGVLLIAKTENQDKKFSNRSVAYRKSLTNQEPTNQNITSYNRTKD